jgi:hypothetical protein
MAVNIRAAAFGVALATALFSGCGGSTPLTAREAAAASVRMSAAINPPADFTRGGGVCPSPYVCWTAPEAPQYTDATYRSLAKRFQVALTEAHCDPPLAGPTGRKIQNCEGDGRYGQWKLVAVLQVTDDGHGDRKTEVSFAPVRRAG